MSIGVGWKASTRTLKNFTRDELANVALIKANEVNSTAAAISSKFGCSMSDTIKINFCDFYLTTNIFFVDR